MFKKRRKKSHERAKELHDKIKNAYTKRNTTIAVLNTEEEITLVGSSEDALRKEVRESLEENEQEVKDKGHAEEKVIKSAKNQNLTPTEIGASRPICLDCEELIKENDIPTETPFSGKRSKKRRKK